MKPQDLELRDTIEAVLHRRENFLEKMEKAWNQLNEAKGSLQECHGSLQKHKTVSRSPQFECQETRLLFGVKLPPFDAYMRDATLYIDSTLWAYLLQLTNLTYLMDKKAKEEFEKGLVENPPPLERSTIEATLKHQISMANEYFKRGVANSFSELSRAFLSHDGWKFGSRIIFDNAFNEYGSWCYHRHTKDSLIDVERVFHILDGKSQPQNSDIITAIDKSREGFRWGKTSRSEAETEYFKARVFKNGNLHIWFLRKDLMVKVNKLLAEYYGETLATGRAGRTEKKGRPVNAVGKSLDFFPTPLPVVKALTRHIYPKGESIRLLEPSAGTGNIAKALLGFGKVDCIEIQPEFARDLKASGVFHKVYQADFMGMVPREEYDFVVMNPPFGGRDIDHIEHAFKFLKKGGRLLSVMPVSIQNRRDKKAVAFRAWVKSLHGNFTDLPKRSFALSGTNVNTVILNVCK